MKRYDASRDVQSGFPTEAGARLGDALLKDGHALDQLEVDLTACKPAMLISAFFNALLQRIYDIAPAKLDTARSIHWVLPFDFQQRNVQRWMADFRAAD